MLSLAVGATDISLDIQFVDDEGLPKTGMAAADMPPIIMSKGTGEDVTITLVDLAAVTDPHTDGGVFERGGGVYRFDPPDTIASTAKIVRLRGEATGKRLICPPIQVGLQDALETALEAAVAALPASTVIGRYADDDADSPTITCKVGETGVAKSVTVTDSNGDAVDLTDWGDKQLIIERANSRTDVQLIANAAITISGASNQTFSFTPSSTVLAQPGDFKWSLREVSTQDVIIDGRLTVSYSPLEDEA